MEDREAKKKYQELIERAENLFQKEKFGAAQYQFSLAYQIVPSEQIEKRIKTCEENAQKIARAQDLLKQGYQLEREKKLPESLAAFRQSLEIWENQEIRRVVEKLKSRLPRPSLAPALKAEAEHRLTEAINKYRDILKYSENEEALARLGICLTKAGEYAEGSSLLESSTLSTIEIHYYAGYALAKLGQYSRALNHWCRISEPPSEFEEQKKALFDLARRDLLKRSQDTFDSSYQEAQHIFTLCSQPEVQECLKKMKLLYLQRLWAEENLEAMLSFLLSAAVRDDLREYLPSILAKVYFRLAETNGRYLPEAISFWLTVIYNNRYREPSSHQKGERVAGQLNNQNIQDIQDIQDLYQRLENLVSYHKSKAESDFSLALRLHWETERDAVQFLVKMAQEEIELANLICTPSFAQEFHLSIHLLEILRGFQSKMDQDEQYWEIGSLFTEARLSVLLLKEGKLEEALARFPIEKEDPFIDYARQRLSFYLGKEKVRKGDAKGKKFFSQALPLLMKFPRYEKELIILAHEMSHDIQPLICLDEILQFILRTYRTEKLLKIASYTMSYKARLLFREEIIKIQDVEKIYLKALELYPKNAIAKKDLKLVRTESSLKEIERTLSRGNLKKAANIALQTGSQAAKKHFLDLAFIMVEEIEYSPLDKQQRKFFLSDLYDQCARIDSSHQILNEITEELEFLEEEMKK